MFDWLDIEACNVLGEGGFCVVQELMGIKSAAQEKACMKTKNISIGSVDETLAETCDAGHSHFHSERELMSSKCQKSAMSTFAVKRIRYSLKGKICARVLIDLSCESKFLSSLSHRKVIELRGESTICNVSHFSDQRNHLFMILDRVFMASSEQIRFWKKRIKKLCFRSAKSIENCALKNEGVETATDAPFALKRLHRLQMKKCTNKHHLLVLPHARHQKNASKSLATCLLMRTRLDYSFEKWHA